MAHNLIPSDDYVPPELISLREPITVEQFEELCSQHRKLRLELTSTGELIIMPFLDLQSGRRNANLTCQLVMWAKKEGSGVCFGSSTVFALPNGARRSPDGSWVKREKWDRVTEREKEGFGSLCPDLVVEVRSPPDLVMQLHNKMSEYVNNDVSVGWLIDPFERRVHVYRPDQEPVVLENPETVSGEPLLPGFTLNLTDLW